MKLTYQHGLAIALLLRVGLCAHVALQDSAHLQVVGVARRVRSVQGSEDTPMGRPATVVNAVRDPLLEATTDPFKTVSFMVPVQVPSAPPVSPPVMETKPVAPPLPYRFFGRMTTVDGGMLTFLSRDSALVPIKVGSVLDEVYRIDTITDKLMSLTYLPLNEQMSIPMQSAVE